MQMMWSNKEDQSHSSEQVLFVDEVRHQFLITIALAIGPASKRSTPPGHFMARG
jgi:hypothetical protein